MTSSKSKSKSKTTRSTSKARTRVEGQLAGPATDPRPVANVTSESDAAPKRGKLPDYAADWPRKGGFGDAPQPWDLQAQGITVATPAPADPAGPAPATTVLQGGKETELAAGAPNTVAPIVVDHGRPILTSGSIDVGPGPAIAGAVTELGQLLGLLGYPNSVTRGTNPFGVVDDSILGAVEKFRDDYDVREDPSSWSRNGRANAESHIGPWTWEGILRAAERVEADADADRRQLAHVRRG